MLSAYQYRNRESASTECLPYRKHCTMSNIYVKFITLSRAKAEESADSSWLLIGKTIIIPNQTKETDRQTDRKDVKKGSKLFSLHRPSVDLSPIASVG